MAGRINSADLTSRLSQLQMAPEILPTVLTRDPAPVEVDSAVDTLTQETVSRPRHGSRVTPQEDALPEMRTYRPYRQPSHPPPNTTNPSFSTQLSRSNIPRLPPTQEDPEKNDMPKFSRMNIVELPRPSTPPPMEDEDCSWIEGLSQLPVESPAKPSPEKIGAGRSASYTIFPKDIPVEERNYHCEVCKLKFRGKTALHSHLCCSICKDMFPSEPLWTSHLEGKKHSALALGYLYCSACKAAVEKSGHEKHINCRAHNKCVQKFQKEHGMYWVEGGGNEQYACQAKFGPPLTPKKQGWFSKMFSRGPNRSSSTPKLTASQSSASMANRTASSSYNNALNLELENDDSFFASSQIPERSHERPHRTSLPVTKSYTTKGHRRRSELPADGMVNTEGDTVYPESSISVAGEPRPPREIPGLRQSSAPVPGQKTIPVRPLPVRPLPAVLQSGTTVVPRPLPIPPQRPRPLPMPPVKQSKPASSLPWQESSVVDDNDSTMLSANCPPYLPDDSVLIPDEDDSLFVGASPGAFADRLNVARPPSIPEDSVLLAVEDDDSIFPESSHSRRHGFYQSMGPTRHEPVNVRTEQNPSAVQQPQGDRFEQPRRPRTPGALTRQELEAQQMPPPPRRFTSAEPRSSHEGGRQEPFSGRDLATQQMPPTQRRSTPAERLPSSGNGSSMTPMLDDFPVPPRDLPRHAKRGSYDGTARQALMGREFIGRDFLGEQMPPLPTNRPRIPDPRPSLGYGPSVAPWVNSSLAPPRSILVPTGRVASGPPPRQIPRRPVPSGRVYSMGNAVTQPRAASVGREALSSQARQSSERDASQPQRSLSPLMRSNELRSTSRGLAGGDSRYPSFPNGMNENLAPAMPSNTERPRFSFEEESGDEKDYPSHRNRNQN